MGPKNGGPSPRAILISANEIGGQAALRIRLHYRKSPISDFGIVKGSAAVTNQDRFVFYSTKTNSFQKGQDSPTIGPQPLAF